MAITSLDGIIAGCKPPEFYLKTYTGSTNTAGVSYSPFYASGIPSVALAPTPGIAGAALTTYAGQIPFTNPSSGQNSYLARFTATIQSQQGQGGAIVLADRLWHNSGISSTSTSSQTVNSVTFPARDENGSTDGVGVLLGVEVSSTMGAGTPDITVTYTNSAGTGSRTATNARPTISGSVTGTFYPIALQAGDNGVRSVQSVQLSATWTSGTFHLVAYRILATTFTVSQGTGQDVITPVSGGLPRLYDNTVPFIILTPSTTVSLGVVASMVVTQG